MIRKTGDDIINGEKDKKMTKLIIVCGLSGSGKTVLAKELSKKLGIACLCKDDIKEKLYEGLNLSTPDDSKQIGKPSVDILLYLAEQQLVNGIDVIIESPFNHSEDYPLFENWKKKYNLDLYSVVCFIDFNERKKRFLTRDRHEAHHDKYRVLNPLVEGVEFDYSTMPGRQIRVETNKSVGELAEYVVGEISN